MIQTLYIIAYTFLKICRFEKGPQDLPRSQTFLLLVMAAYICVSPIIPHAFGMPLSTAIIKTWVEIGITFFLTASLLYVTGYYARTLQTLTAILGVDVFFHFVAMPLFILEFYLKSMSVDIGIIQLLAIGLVIWNIAVYAHVLRHALASEFYTGLIVTFIYLVVTVAILQSLFGIPEVTS